MSGNHLSRFPRLAPAAGPSPEGSPVFFGVTMPRRWPQGWWCSRGLFDDFIDGLDYDEYLRSIIDVYADDPSEDELDDYVEHLDNRRW
jgi:hypothetical protein